MHIAEKVLFKQLKAKGVELHVTGYSGQIKTEEGKDEFLSGTGHHQLWGMKGKSWFFESTKDGEFIGYKDILTTSGQSGSGVFYKMSDTNEYYVIGVHALGREGGSHNSGTWITKKRFNQIQEWVNQSKKKLIEQSFAIENSGEGWKIKTWNYQPLNLAL